MTELVGAIATLMGLRSPAGWLLAVVARVGMAIGDGLATMTRQC
jgi:XapX domain-containing protein